MWPRCPEHTTSQHPAPGKCLVLCNSLTRAVHCSSSFASWCRVKVLLLKRQPKMLFQIQTKLKLLQSKGLALFLRKGGGGEKCNYLLLCLSQNRHGLGVGLRGGRIPFPPKTADHFTIDQRFYLRFFSKFLSTQCQETHCSRWFFLFIYYYFAFSVDLKTYHYEISCAVEPSSWLPDTQFSFQSLVLLNGQWCLPI